MLSRTARRRRIYWRSLRRKPKEWLSPETVAHIRRPVTTKSMGACRSQANAPPRQQAHSPAHSKTLFRDPSSEAGRTAHHPILLGHATSK